MDRVIYGRSGGGYFEQAGDHKSRLICQIYELNMGSFSGMKYFIIRSCNIRMTLVVFFHIKIEMKKVPDTFECVGIVSKTSALNPKQQSINPKMSKQPKPSPLFLTARWAVFQVRKKGNDCVQSPCSWYFEFHRSSSMHTARRGAL